MITFSYDDELGILHTITGGDLSIDEILGHYQEIRQISPERSIFPRIFLPGGSAFLAR